MSELNSSATSSPTAIALTRFVEQAIAQQENGLFHQPYDDQWTSPCEVQQLEGSTFWRPLLREHSLDFSGLANAAEAPIHQSIQDYYNLYWAGTLTGTTTEGDVSLIQVWNQDDFTRLLENLVGHLFYKIRAKAPFTVFFANTDDDSELFLSVDNETGAVLLEEPGRPPIRQVAPCLASFIERIEPDNRPPAIY